MIKSNQLRKNERLSNFRLTKLIFNKGYSFKSYPFIFHWQIISKDSFIYNNTPSIKASTPWHKSKTGLKKTHYDIKGNALPANTVFHYPAKTMFLVSKKNFKKAVDRNNIKRLLREAYRKNKSIIYSFLKEEGFWCLLAINYIGEQKPKQEDLEKHLIVSLQKLIKNIELNAKKC